MSNRDLLYGLKGITPEEFLFVEKVMDGMSPPEAHNFVLFYSGKRQNPTELLLFTLLGFFIVAGVQRFLTGQIGMGILYLLTGGLCLVGTIVDAINYKSLAFEYNRKLAIECAQMVKQRQR